MTPAARVQAAIELLDQIIGGARSKGAPADRLIAAYFKARRYAGSKDRRAVRDRQRRERQQHINKHQHREERVDDVDRRHPGNKRDQPVRAQRHQRPQQQQHQG